MEDDMEEMDEMDSDYDEEPSQPEEYKPQVDNIHRVTKSFASPFSASPPIIHFSGLIAGQPQKQVISIINRSATSQRMLIVPPVSKYFSIEYEKRGLLAPGMAQKVVVTFNPEEFKYYYDCINVRGEEHNLMIPIHGYPIVNKIDFPTHLSFGTSPLCEPVTRKIKLRCTIPINFGFTIEVIKPHPYMQIAPLNGIIPANGVVEISLTFFPLTLESVLVTLLLRVAQDNFVPMECTVTARALSGKIECSKLLEAESRVADYLMQKGSALNETLGAKSTFQGSLQKSSMLINSNLTMKTGLKLDTKLVNNPLGGDRSQTLRVGEKVGLLQKSPKKNHFLDPAATVLASTFRSSDVNSTLNSVLQDALLLKQKERTGPSESERTRMMGPGSGAVFDAGSQWIDAAHQKANKKKKKSKSKSKELTTEIGGMIPSVDEDKIIDGYRIPPQLDSTTAVNFVLTQERGKLKPKDLKAAIEKNRAERESRALEQKKMREGTVGDVVGLLDLRAILGEERLNIEAGGPFKRQLRELTFLTEVDEVNKLEIEKGFRISEEYMGTDILTTDEIEVVKNQRKEALLFKKRSNWRQTISSQHTKCYLPTDPNIKAGSSAETAKSVVDMVSPTFDTNTNDVWSKRLNTLRRFVALVSRWLVRKRVGDRMASFKAALDAAGVTTWEEGRKFIAEENATYRSKPVQPRAKSRAATSNESLATSEAAVKSIADGTELTVASMICSQPNAIQANKLRIDQIIVCEKFVPKKEMFRRQLFPRFIPDDNSALLPLPAVPVTELTSFDDRTLFQLKIRPEFITMQYEAFKLPPVPLSLPPAKNEVLRIGAAEECAHRPPADSAMSGIALLESVPPDPSFLASVRIVAVENLTLLPDPRHPEIPVPAPTIDECNLAMPGWMCKEPDWNASELDFFSIRPELRVYMPEPTRKESDVDWTLRPLALGRWFEYDPDTSLRSQWAQHPGFASINRYLLGAYESRNNDPPPLPGPTLSDFYLPDLDRHRSGLNCFDKDHKRHLTQRDADIKPLTYKQDKTDVLTDSESDDEDGYKKQIPTMELVRAALNAVIVETAPVVDASKSTKGGKGGKPGKGAAPAPAATATATAVAATSEPVTSIEDESSDIKEDQVELMRDRKTLELESAQRKTREKNADAVRARLAELSASSTCLLQALPLQVPFHCYEAEVYKLMEPRMPPVLTTYALAGSPAGKFTSPMIAGTEAFAFSNR